MGRTVERSYLEFCMLIVSVFLMLDRVDSFNVDTHNIVKHRGNHGSMFGFSVALHREKSSSWLIIGAPLAQTLQPGVERGGAVFRCDIARDDTCTLIEFDMKGNNNDSYGKPVDMKSFQWFGATVSSSGENGVVLACAPRYIWFSTHPNRRDPVGTCYVAKNQFSEFAEYSPCRTRNWGYHRQGSCQAGLGASVSRDGRRLYVGAVGSWYWQGQVHSIDAFARLLFLPPRYTIIEEGQVISQSTHARPDVISTREGPSTDDDSYLGYSVTVGDFGGRSEGFNDVAVGMPRGAGLLGKVVLYNWNMTNLKNFTGEQLGAYFGYSLAACDVNGDGRDDIIVGAPLYTDMSDNKGYYETGRVYIIYQGNNYLWGPIDSIDGTNSRSRFGLSLAALGDINLDGFADFAVGAPYDGPKERGAVYIFLGTKRGANLKPSQIVYSEQVAGQPTTFGFSLAGGLDLDENLYPDLLVGAYESETAVFLRSRPVVHVEASLAFLLPSKQISLEEKNCTLKDRTKVPCVELNTCLKYSGTNVDGRLEFQIQFVLDSKKPHNPRLFFLSEENRNIMNQTIRLDKNSQFCKKTFVYIKPNIRDKLTSLEAEMRYGLKGSELSATRRVARLLQPILDQTQQDEFHKRDSIIIQKDCGRDNICIPDLRLIATPSVNKYLLGSGDRLEIDVVVQNEGEDAFEAVYELQVPTGLNYVKIEKVEPMGKEVLPVLCSAPSFLNKNTLHCDIGNPLPKEKIVHFKVIMQPYRVDGLKPRYEFNMFVNSTNPENSSSTSDNQKQFNVPIWVETDLILQGSSHPSDVFYNMTQYQNAENITQESQIGPQVNHIYSIRNKGPSDIIEAEAYFLWPSYTLAGEHLFYLTEQPEVTGNVKCQVIEEVNVEKLNMEKRKQAQYESSYGSPVQSGLTGSHPGAGSHSSSSSSGSSYSSSSSSTHTSSSSSGNWRGQGSLSAEEKRRLEEAARRREEDTGEAGDASERHRERWRQTHHSSSGGSSGTNVGRNEGGYTGTWRNQSSWSSSTHGGRGSSSGGGRVEGSRTEHSGSWSSERTGGGSSSGSDRRVSYDHGLGGASLGKEVIIDTRGSGMSSGSWSGGGGSIDIDMSRIPIESGHRTWENRTRTEHRTSSRHPSGNQGERWESSHNRGTGRQDEAWRGHYPGPNATHFEERHYERNSSWNSGDRKPQVSTNWTINRDGVIEGGSHRGEGDSFIESRDGSYFRNRDKGWNDTWMVSGSGSRDHERDERYESDYDHRRTYDRPAGVRNYTEGRTTVKNTTWSSQGGPAVTSEHSSWSVSRDGVTRNGSQSRIYHDKDDSGREKSGSYDTSRENYDRNMIRGGGGGGSRTYSEEREVHRNTSWSSADGKPITEERRHWRIDQDGTVSSGSTSRTYEGDHDSRLGHESSRERGYDSTRVSGSRSSSGSVHGEDRTHAQREEFSGGHSQTSWTSSGRQEQSGSRTSSEEERRRSETSQASREQHERTQEGGYRNHAPTNTNIGDLLNSRRTSDAFGGLGDIAVGPKDGVAKTYSFDLGILDSGNRESSSSSERRGGSSSSDNRGSGSRVYTSESGGGEHNRGGYSSGSSRHYEFGSSSDSDRGSGSGRTESRYSSSRGGGFSATHKDDDDRGHVGGSTSYERSSSSSSRSGSSSGGSSGYGGGSTSYERSSSSSSRSGSSSGGSSGYSGGSTSYERSSSSSSSSHSRSGGGSGSSGYSSTSGTADGDSTLHGGMYSRRQEYSSSSQSSHYGPRSRRQVDDVEDFDTVLECSTTKCVRVRCTVGPLKKDEEAIIKFKSRVWVQTLKKLAGWNKVNVSSMLVARVSKLPHIGRPDVATTRSHEVLTQLVPRHPPPKPEVVPLWIIVLSACAGAILLMLLVFILYKLGFFKRNRPSNSPEKQPLNRNGHYQPGDEAL